MEGYLRTRAPNEPERRAHSLASAAGNLTAKIAYSLSEDEEESLSILGQIRMRMNSVRKKEKLEKGGLQYFLKEGFDSCELKLLIYDQQAL